MIIHFKLHYYNLPIIDFIYCIKRTASSEIRNHNCSCVISFCLYLEIVVMMATKQ
jgi:hypothetical protein